MRLKIGPYSLTVSLRKDAPTNMTSDLLQEAKHNIRTAAVYNPRLSRYLYDRATPKRLVEVD